MNTKAHQPVLLKETIEHLDIKADGIYIDATFGRGGHSKAILEHLGGKGMLIAIDQDPDAIASGQALAAAYPQLRLVHDSFAPFLISSNRSYPICNKTCGISTKTQFSVNWVPSRRQTSIPLTPTCAPEG